jgi:DNA-binding transcriptional MerR regulator
VEFEKNTYSINEVADRLDANASTLRSWEKEFHLKIPRNNRNHRYYTEREIEIFNIIIEGRDKNLGLAAIKKALEEHAIIEDQNESATKLMKVDQLTVEELQDAMFSKFKEVVAEVVIERENELKRDFEEKLKEREEALTEQMTMKIREQLEAENKKLMEHIASTREQKKGFWSKLFNKND